MTLADEPQLSGSDLVARMRARMEASSPEGQAPTSFGAGLIERYRARELPQPTFEDLGYRHLTEDEQTTANRRATGKRGFWSTAISGVGATFGGKNTPMGIGSAIDAGKMARFVYLDNKMRGPGLDRDEELEHVEMLSEAVRTPGVREMAGDIVGTLPGFGVEMAAGVGVATRVGTAGTRMAREAAIRTLRDRTASEAQKAMTKRLMRSTVFAGAGKVAAAGAGVAAVTGAVEAVPRLFGQGGGRWTAYALEKALPELQGMDAEDWQALEGLSNAAMVKMLATDLPLWQGALDTAIETGSEFAGAGIGRALHATAAGARVLALQGLVLQKIAGKVGNRGRDLLDDLATRVRYDGPIVEMLEERLGDFARVGTGLEGAETLVPGVDQLAAEAIALSFPALGGAAVRRAVNMTRAGQAEKGSGAPAAAPEPEGVETEAADDGARRAAQPRALAPMPGDIVWVDAAGNQGVGEVLAITPTGVRVRLRPEHGAPGEKVRTVDVNPSEVRVHEKRAPEGLSRADRLARDAAPAAVPSSAPLPEAPALAGGIQGALSAAPLLGTQGGPQGRDAATMQDIGRGLAGTLAPTTERQTHPVRIMDALADTVQAAGGRTPIRSGRVRKKWALGHFDVKQETIELLRSNDIDVAAHEVAHAIEKHIFGWSTTNDPWTSGAAGVDPAGVAELERLGTQLYGAQKPTGGFHREGWSEYVRLWTMEGGAENTPALDAWFSSKFLPANPKVATKLENVRDLATVWRTQGSLNRGRRMIVREEELSEKARKVRRAVAQGVIQAKVYDDWVEMFGPLKRATSEAERKLGSTLPIEKNPFEIASAWRLTAPARAQYMAEHGMLDLAGNVVGPPLVAIKPLVGGRYEDFVVYLYAKRGKALIEDPKAEGPGGRDPGISLEDANEIIKELGSPEFEQAAQLVYRWNEGLLDYMAQASPTLAMAVDAIRKRDPGAYLPLQREFDEIRERAAGGKQAVKRGTASQRLKGSGRRVKDPFPRMLEAAERRIKLAHERHILEAVVALRDIEGMGHLIEEVPVDQVPSATRSIGQLIDAIAKKSPNPFAGTNLSNAVSAEGISSADPITLFDQSHTPTNADETPVIPIIDKGKIRYFRIGDPALYKSLEGLDIYRLPKFLDWVFGVPKRLFVSGVTSLSPAFGLISNPARDFQTYLVNTRASNPVMAAAGWTQMAGHMFASAATGGKYRSEYMEVYERLGVNMARRLSADSAPTRRAARRIAGRRVIDMQTPGDMLDVFRDVIQFSEGAPRQAEMQVVAERTGWAPGMPMSLAQSIEIGLAGKRVTTDFSAAGRLARIANQAIPFFNVAIQGPRAALIAAKNNPAKFAGVGFTMMTMPAVVLWMMQQDEDWYEEMADEEKYAYFYFQVGDEIARFPRAHEIGFVFASLPEMLLNRWKEDDPEGAVEWARSMAGYTGKSLKEAWRVMAPDALPVPVGLAAEQLANRSFFWDSPIVARGLQDRPVEEQFDDFTSQASIAIGEAMGLSPKRVEHTIKYLTGTVGSEILKVFGRGIDDVDLEPELADLPVLGRLVRRGGAEGGRAKSVDELYDLSHDALVRSRSSRVKETREQRQERLMLADATKAISALSHARSITSSVEARRKISATATKIAQDALSAVESSEALRSRGRASSARKRAELLELRAERELANKRLRAEAGEP